MCRKFSRAKAHAGRIIQRQLWPSFSFLCWGCAEASNTAGPSLAPHSINGALYVIVDTEPQLLQCIAVVRQASATCAVAVDLEGMHTHASCSFMHMLCKRTATLHTHLGDLCGSYSFSRSLQTQCGVISFILDSRCVLVPAPCQILRHFEKKGRCVRS